MKSRYHTVSGIVAALCVGLCVGIGVKLLLYGLILVLPVSAGDFLYEYNRYIIGIAIFTTFILVRQQFEGRQNHKTSDPVIARKKKIRQHLSNLER